ncbi:ATP-grasp domain-containing protein [Tomitella gaofuii]|uniref:ATP-grasp domain-containing protein n=1 Tax=Tomitella gaofuii TaxID=2760083 RepID=UPI0015FC0BCB|nr:ATP-grasp domain-containing protein [Tomitella gaofuii]
MDRARKNVFVVGADEYNQRILDAMPDVERYRFLPVLTFEDVYGGTLAFESALRAAEHIIDAARVPVDAVIGFWDFPVSALVLLLRERYGLPAVRLEELLMCEHKYWSRLVQREVIDEYPPFALVDPDNDRRPPDAIRFPMWIKPVKSFGSMLAFGVDDDAAFAAALTQIKEGIGWIGAPFDALLEHVSLPARIAAVGGRMCLAEEAITGRQLTVEGYQYHGDVVIYGIVDSVRYDNSPSFQRFEYPSSIPDRVAARLADIASRLVHRIGLESMTFNIEFFWDPGTDAVTLLEINPRHSQSHAELFAHVDGMSNHEVMLRLALGEAPLVRHRQGRYRIAAKCFARRFTDGIVRRCPSAEEIMAIERVVPGVSIVLAAREGDVLSRLKRQDSYSYHLASIYIGADDDADLRSKFHHTIASLTFEIDDTGPLPARLETGAP